MNHKLAGTIFIMLGMGLLGSSVEDLFTNSFRMDGEGFKSIVGILIGIAGTIYGFKRMKNKLEEG